MTQTTEKTRGLSFPRCNRKVMRKRLTEALAHFLADDMAAKSAALEEERSRDKGDPRPKVMEEWSQLLSAAGLSWCDYTTAKAAIERILSDT